MLTNMTFGWYAECKGQAQAIATNTENFAQTLQGVFTQQLSTQQSQLQALNTQLNNMITNPQGYSASGLAAMETAATTQNATNYANAQQSLNNQIQTMQGGNAGLPSGAAAMLEGQLQSSAANQQSQSQLGIAQANANVMLQQQSQGLSMLPGEIQAQGQLPGSASSVLTAQNNAFNQQNAIVSPWMKLLQTAVGAAVGGFTGGLGNSLGGGLGSSLFGNSASGLSAGNMFNQSLGQLGSTALTVSEIGEVIGRVGRGGRGTHSPVDADHRPAGRWHGLYLASDNE